MLQGTLNNHISYSTVEEKSGLLGTKPALTHLWHALQGFACQSSEDKKTDFTIYVHLSKGPVNSQIVTTHLKKNPTNESRPKRTTRVLKKILLYSCCKSQIRLSNQTTNLTLAIFSLLLFVTLPQTAPPPDPLPSELCSFDLLNYSFHPWRMDFFETFWEIVLHIRLLRSVWHHYIRNINVGTPSGSTFLFCRDRSKKRMEWSGWLECGQTPALGSHRKHFFHSSHNAFAYQEDLCPHMMK